MPPGPSLPSQFDPLFQNGHLQTVLARFWRSGLDFRRYPGQKCLFRTEAGVTVLAWLHHHSVPSLQTETRDTLVIVHGLEGSADAGYVLRTAAVAVERGFDVLRLNVRNCGGTEHLADTLYHSGLTTDLRSVCGELSNRRLFVVGFSMGGNMALKLAGEWGEVAPPHIAGACAVSPPIDLAACARRMGETRNWPYEQRFLRSLKKKLKSKSRLSPGRPPSKTSWHIRSLIDFDNTYTAPAFGFKDAFDYYEQASSIHFLDAIRLPTLVIQAQDDPFIPFEVFAHPSFRQNPQLSLVAPPHGGHVAFLARGPFRFWASRTIVHFCEGLRGGWAPTKGPPAWSRRDSPGAP